MPAYIHGEIEITDPEAYEEYRRQVPAMIAAFGGRYLVRGGAAVAMADLGEEINPGDLGRAMGLFVAGNAFGGMVGRVGVGVLAALRLRRVERP